MEKRAEIKLRHWVYVDDVKFLGPGRCELMQRIEQTGSIASAAKEMGMSYKKAWLLVEELNSGGSAPYVVTQKGGTKGGGTSLTDTGRRVLAAYRRLDAKLLAVAREEAELLASI